MLAICGKGAANESVLLGFCIGQAESKELILHFLAFLAYNRIVIDQPQYTVLGDRGRAIVAALGEALTSALFMYCEQHLKRNLKGQDFEATDDLLRDYSAIVNAVTEHEYNRRMALLQVKCPQMHTYLSNVDPTGNWVLWKAIHRGNRLMGVHSDNMVETIFAVLLPARKKRSVYFFVTAAFATMNEKYIKHFKKSESARYLHTCAVKKHFDKLQQEISQRRERVVVQDVRPGRECGTVQTNCGGAWENVNLAAKQCSCQKWQQIGIMCIHAFLFEEKVAEILKRQFDPYQASFVEDLWTTANYQSFYKGVDRKFFV